tara:strand:+ start:221 stop:889 length:669 start_codon:yes stop_codon:yes gene_type:complete
MPQQINKKIYKFLFLFLLLASLNNKDFTNFELPKIDRVNILGFDSEKDNLIKNLEILKIRNLFFLKKNQIVELLDQNNLIESYKVFKKYPASLEISIIKTKFLAYINLNNKYYFLGSNGKLIETTDRSKKIPYIFGNLKIKQFFRLKETINETNLNYKDIKNLFYFSSGRWDIELNSGILLKLPKEQLKDSIELCLNLLNTKEFVNVKMIDVRQNNQVITNE